MGENQLLKACIHLAPGQCHCLLQDCARGQGQEDWVWCLLLSSLLLQVCQGLIRLQRHFVELCMIRVCPLFIQNAFLPLRFNLLFSPSPSSWWSLITVLFQVHLVANDAGHHRWIHSNICCVFLGWTLNNNILWICFCSCLLPPCCS